MLPCWQLQELAEGIGDINTEGKLLLLIITFMCVREQETLSGQKEEKETGSQRGRSSGVSSTRLAHPRGLPWRPETLRLWGRGGLLVQLHASPGSSCSTAKSCWLCRGSEPTSGAGSPEGPTAPAPPNGTFPAAGLGPRGGWVMGLGWMGAGADGVPQPKVRLGGLEGSPPLLALGEAKWAVPPQQRPGPRPSAGGDRQPVFGEPCGKQSLDLS